MHVFTVHRSSIPQTPAGNEGNIVPGTMIQSQPINLATNKAARVSETFPKLESTRLDSFPTTSSRNSNAIEQQAQDLSTHSHQRQLSSQKVDHNNLLDFCNIILSYTNYPEAFREEFKPFSQLEVKGRFKTNSRFKNGLDSQEKRKLSNSTASVKLKPGRKPKGTGKGMPARVDTKPNFDTDSITESSGIGTKRFKIDDGRVNGRRRERKLSSPLNSVGESARESTHSSSSSTSSNTEDRESQPSNLFYPDDDRDESWEEVTCFCGKPFAGRMMIECENCFVWHHMSCAKIRKTNVPKKFYCRDCKHLFPDPVEERQRRASGNSGGDMNHLPKTPAKANKTGPSTGDTLTSLVIPSMISDRSISPKESPSLYFPPKNVNGLSRFPAVIKSAGSATTQFRTRQTPFADANSELKLANGSQPAICQNSPRKTNEKPKRRPTLNSASSGLYDDVLLPLRLNFSSIGTQNGISS